MANTERDGSFSRAETEEEPEFLETSKMQFLYKTFPLLDNLEVNWPTIVVTGGIILEIFQYFSLLFNTVYPWGPVLKGASLPIYFVILPFWDSDYPIHVNFGIYSVFFWLLFCALLAMFALLSYHFARPRSHKTALFSVTKIMLYTIVGPLFLPCLHGLLSMMVCSGSPLSLTAYPDRKCFSSSDPLVIVQSLFGIIGLLLLLLYKVVITMLIYDDHPLSDSPRARTHSLVEGWLLVFQLISAVLFHYLPAVGQRETFSALFATGAFFMCVLHAVYLPFMHQKANLIRSVGFACLFFCGLVVTLILALADRTALYRGTGKSNWDALIIIVGIAFVSILSYRIASLRVSNQFRRDLARAIHGTTSNRNASTHMKFPYYLPTDERSDFNEEDALSSYLSKGGGGGGGGGNQLKTSMSNRSFAASYVSGVHDSFWKNDANIEEFNDYPLASYIDAIYLVSDVEVATRFLSAFTQSTSSHPSPHALGFAFRIYVKGLTRFVRDDWLQLQFATFLCCYTTRLNPSGLQLCEDLNRRELSPVLAYRLHRRINSINVAYMHRQRESKKALFTAQALHRDSLINIRNFWRHLAHNQIGVSELSAVAAVIVDGIYGGMHNYSRAIQENPDTSTITRYAQFLDHVALDAESATTTREFALELAVRQEAGTLAKGDVSTASIVGSSVRGKRTLGNHYSKYSRSLRKTLLFLLVIIFSLLIGFLITIIVTHNNDLTSIDRISLAGRCRLHAVRSLWVSYLAMSSPENDVSWSWLREQLDELRNVNMEITYGRHKSLYSHVVALMKQPLFTFFYGDSGESEDMGIWRSGEVFISSLETLIQSQTTSNARSNTFAVLSSNELTGAIAAYNASIDGFLYESNHQILMSEFTVIALFFLSLAFISICFLAFRYYLACISGSRLSALGLFRLIPDTALQPMVKKISDRIDAFDDPDEIFESMLVERGLKASSAPEEADEALTMQSGPPIAKAPPGTSLGNNPAGNASNTITNNSISPSLADPTSIMEEDDAHLEGKFALLSRNSTVADVGRLRFAQGEYEAPYSKDSFKPREMLPEERMEFQRQIDDIEVEESLIRHREAVASGADAKNRRHEDDHRVDDLIKSSTTSRLLYRVFRVLIPLSCLVIGVVVGVLAIRRFLLLDSDASLQIPFIHSIQKCAFMLTDMLDAAEGVAFYPSKETMDTLLVTLEDMRVTDVEMTSIVDGFASAKLTSNYATFRNYFTKTYLQSLSAAVLGCASAQIVDCSALSSISWTRELFLPTPYEHMVFDPSMALPRGKAIDMKEPPQTMETLARNIIASPYYSYLKANMQRSFLLSKNTIQSEEGERLDRKVEQDAPIKKALLAFAVVLVVACLIHIIESRILFPKNSTLIVSVIVCLLLSIFTLVAAAILFKDTLPQEGPYKDTVARYDVIEGIYTTSNAAREDSKQAAFAGVPLGAVDFEYTGFVALDAVWVKLFNAMGSGYLSQLTNAYNQFEFCSFLDSIIVTLGCKFNNFNPDICALEHLADLKWNIADETFGYRLQLQYEGTTQLLYSNRQHDMNVLTSPEQWDLSRSLAFGPLRSSRYLNGRNTLLATLASYAQSQRDLSDARFNMQQPLTLSAAVAAFVVVAVNLFIIFGLAMDLMDEYHMKAGIQTTNNAALASEDFADKSFRRLVKTTVLVLVIFSLVITILFIALIVSYELSRKEEDMMNIATLRGVQLLQSAISIQNSERSPWFTETALSFAGATLASSEKYYRMNNLKFMTNLADAIFGPLKVTSQRYDEHSAINTSVVSMENQQSLLAFGGLIDASQRRWQQRVMEMVVMDASSRQDQEALLYQQIFTLSKTMQATTATMTQNTRDTRDTSFAVFIFVLCITILAFFLMSWYLLFVASRRLMKEEEGTQVMLRMIPLEIRKSIPAIAEYLASGRTIQDANVAEIDIAAREYNVLPTITVDSHGIIRHYCKAAEEVFQWTRAEAVGQNVGILMPDNIAAEHNSYIQKYLTTGVKTVMGTSRLVRVKRKDGSLLPAQLQLQEVRTEKGISFVGVVHNRQDDLEFERNASLSIALSEASTIPVVVIDRRGVIMKFNKACEITFKCSADEVIGRKVNILMPRAEADVHDQYLERYLRTGKKTMIDSSRYVKAKRFNGEVFPILLSVREMRQGGRWYYIGQIEDMTDRLHYEMIAAASNITKMRSPIPLIISDSEGRVIFVSESACRAFGYSDSELHRRPVSILMEEPLASHHNVFFKHYSRVGSTRRAVEQRTVQGSARRREKDGTFSTFQARITLKGFSITGVGDCVLAFVENIAPKQSLEMHGKISNMTMVMGAIPVVVFDDSGIIVQMNKAAESTFRTSAANMYGKDVDHFFVSNAEDIASANASATVWATDDKVPPSAINSSEYAGTTTARAVYRTNPLQVILDEYRKSGLTNWLGRSLKGLAHTIEGNSVFDVEVRVTEVTQSNRRLFLAYIRDTTDDLRLLETNHWNDALMAVTTIPVVISTLDGIVLACSDSACKQFGYTREEFIGINVSVLMPDKYGKNHDLYLDNFRKCLDAVAKGRKVEKKASLLHREVVLTGRTRTGFEFPVGISIKDIHTNGSEPFLVAGLRDCTSEINLAVHHSICRAMTSLAPVPLIIVTSSGIIKEFSPSAEAFFGYDSSEVVGHNIRMLMQPEVGALHDGYLRSFEKTGMRQMIGHPRVQAARCKNGLIFNMMIYVKDVRRGDTLEYVAFMCNVNERHALRQAQDVRRIVTNLDNAAMAELDLDGVILRCSDVLKQELGYEDESLAGRSIYNLLPHSILASDKTTSVASQDRWLKQALTELKEAQYSGTGHTQSVPQKIGHKTLSFCPSGNLARVTRRLSAQHKNGDVVLYEVSIALAPRNLLHAESSPTAGSLLNAAVVTETQRYSGAQEEELGVIVYLRNLSAHFSSAIEIQKQSAAVSLSPSVFIIVDDHCRVKEFSASAEETFGFTNAEIVGKHIDMIFEPKSASAIMQYLQRYLATGVRTLTTGKAQIMTARHKGGRLFQVDLHVRESKDGQGIPHFIANLRVVDSEFEAVAEDALNTALLKDAPIAIIGTNHEGVVEEYTGAAERLLRLPQLEILGKSIRILRATPLALDKERGQDNDDGDAQRPRGETQTANFFAENMTYNEKQQQQQRQLQKSVQERVIITCGDGTTFKASVRIRAIVPYRSKMPRYFAYIEPIDQSLLVQSETKEMLQLFNASLSSIVVVNVHGVVMRCNAAAEELFQYTEQEMVSHALGDLLKPDMDRYGDRATAGNALVDTLEEGVDKDRENASPNKKLLSTLVEAFHMVQEGAIHSSDPSHTFNEDDDDYQSSRRTSFLNIGESDLFHVASVPWTRRDGKTIVTNVTVIAVPGSSAGDEPEGVLHIWNGTDEIAAAAYRSREAQIQDYAHVGCVEVDLDGRFLECSRLFLSTLGYIREDLVGRLYSLFVPVGDVRLAQFIAKAQEAVRQGQPTPVERHTVLTFRDKRDALMRVGGEFRCIVRPGGSLFSVIVDTRLPKPIDKQMSQTAFSMMGLSREAMMLVSYDGFIQYANEAAHKLFKSPVHLTMVGNHVDSLVEGPKMHFSAAATEAAAPAAASAAIPAPSDLTETFFLSTLHNIAATARSGVSHTSEPTVFTGMTYHREGEEADIFKFEVSARDISEVTESLDGSEAGSMLLVEMHPTITEKGLDMQMRTVQKALDSSFHAAVVLSSTGVIGLFSSVAEELFGLPASAVVGRNINGLLFSEEKGQKIMENMEVFRRTGQSELIETPQIVLANYYGIPASGSSHTIHSDLRPTNVVRVELVLHNLKLTSNTSEYEFVAHFCSI